MKQLPDHPEIEQIERTGYPSWMREDNDEDAYDNYCDRCYEEQRDRKQFGE